MKVAGRTSAFSFKGKDEDIRVIGEKLNVKMVLEGSVRKSGNKVHITAQLINVEDDFHIFSERFKEALVSFNNALELDPDYSDGHHWKGVVLGYLGKYEEAISSLNRALDITQGEGLATIDLLGVKIQMGKKDEALKIMKSWEYIDPGDAAKLYTMLEMPDDAIFWLEKGYRERSVMMVGLKHFWIWDPIRDDPRFIEIYDRMNFHD